jgi:hypothetical protein
LIPGPGRSRIRTDGHPFPQEIPGTEIALFSDVEKFRDEVDKVHGLIHQVHRRVDTHLSDDDSDKRLMRLALERLDDRVTSIESRELSFYGSEDLTPSDFYKREDAQEAFDDAKWAYETCREALK